MAGAADGELVAVGSAVRSGMGIRSCPDKYWPVKLAG